MRKFILVYSVKNPDDYDRLTEVEYLDSEKDLHDRVTALAREEEEFKVECSGALGKQWKYEAVQQAIEMVPEEIKGKKKVKMDIKGLRNL